MHTKLDIQMLIWEESEVWVMILRIKHSVLSCLQQYKALWSLGSSRRGPSHSSGRPLGLLPPPPLRGLVAHIHSLRLPRGHGAKWSWRSIRRRENKNTSIACSLSPEPINTSERAWHTHTHTHTVFPLLLVTLHLNTFIAVFLFDSIFFTQLNYNHTLYSCASVTLRTIKNDLININWQLRL